MACRYSTLYVADNRKPNSNSLRLKQCLKSWNPEAGLSASTAEFRSLLIWPVSQLLCVSHTLPSLLLILLSSCMHLPLVATSTAASCLTSSQNTSQEKKKRTSVVKYKFLVQDLLGSGWTTCLTLNKSQGPQKWDVDKLNEAQSRNENRVNPTYQTRIEKDRLGNDYHKTNKTK